MTLSEYSHLKQQVIVRVVANERHKSIVETLKDLFRDDINSVRKFDEITTIGDLLHILELRDLLSENNVKPLKQIVQKLSNSNDLLNKILQYESCHVPRELQNYYEIQNTIPLSYPRQPEYLQNHVYISPTKRQRIIQTIVEEIGCAWRDLGRYLKIQEVRIQEIDNSNITLAQKALKVLEHYLENKSEPDKWVFHLCDALENSRRRDLAKTLTTILNMNI